MVIRRLHLVLFQYLFIPFINTHVIVSLLVDQINIIMHQYVCVVQYCCWYNSIFYLGMVFSNLDFFWWPFMSLVLLLCVLHYFFQAQPILNCPFFHYNTEECQHFSGIFLSFLVRVVLTCCLPLYFQLCAVIRPISLVCCILFSSVFLLWWFCNKIYVVIGMSAVTCL